MSKIYGYILRTLLLTPADSKLRKAARWTWQKLISLVINLLKSVKSYLSINNLKAVLSLANLKKSGEWLEAILNLSQLIFKIIFLWLAAPHMLEIMQMFLAGQRISIEQLNSLMEIAHLIFSFQK